MLELLGVQQQLSKPNVFLFLTIRENDLLSLWLRIKRSVKRQYLLVAPEPVLAVRGPENE